MVSTKPAHQVTAIAFAPNGRILASGGADKCIELWEVSTWRLLRTLTGHTATITGLAFDDESETLASGALDGSAALWDIRSGQRTHSLSAAEPNSAVTVTFPSPGILLSASARGPVRTWSAATGVELVALPLTGGTRVAGVGGYCLALETAVGTALWNVDARTPPRTLASHSDVDLFWLHGIGAAALSSEAGRLAVATRHTRYVDPAERFVIRVCDTTTAAVCGVLRGHTASVRRLSMANTLLASYDDEGTIRIWNHRTCELLCMLPIQRGERTPGQCTVHAMAFDPTEQILAVSEGTTEEILAFGDGNEPWWGRIRLWNAHTGTQVGVIERHAHDVNTVAFSPTEPTLAVAGEDGRVWRWRLDTGTAPTALQGHTGRVATLCFTPDGRALASVSWDGTARCWNAASGVGVMLHDSAVRQCGAAIHPNGVLAATGGDCGDLRLWDLASCTLRATLRSGELLPREIVVRAGGDADIENKIVYSVAFSPDGGLLAEGGLGLTRLWNTELGTIVHRLHAGALTNLAFQPGGGILASGGFDQVIRFWSTETGELVRQLITTAPRSIEMGVPLSFRADGKVIASGDASGHVRIWDVATGTLLADVQGHAGCVSTVAFDRGGALLASGGFDASVVLWDVRTATSPRKICTLYAFVDGTWAVIDPEGRFDASNAGDIPWLSWVVGFESISLDQLKDRYYEPELLRKLIFPDAEPLREVRALAELDLYPALEVLPRERNDPRIRIRLTNRGGGIGRVVASLNGKELTHDARGARLDRSEAEHAVEIDLRDSPLLLPGVENTCELRVYNADDYMVSREIRIRYDAPPAAAKESPELWAIIAGVSAYRGDLLKLQFAADDAKKIARAIRVAGEHLFGAERVHVQLLTSPTSPDEGGELVTGENVRRAFGAVANKARSCDVLFVFLAGHGASHGGAEGDYYYLTADASSGNLDDPKVRGQTALSSEQLTELIGKVAALKQVLILDTCAAGAWIDKLSSGRAVPASQIRALDRMKDRMGLYILAGATADRVAYESSRHNQGLLTYSLLFGMRGAALADDEIIDVGRLFDHVVDHVPGLAEGVGGIQQPLLSVPRGGSSFSIGRLPREARDAIQLAPVRVVVQRAELEDEATWFDGLGLTRQVNDALQAASATITFVGAAGAEFPGAVRLKARYIAHGTTVSVNARVVQDGTEIDRFSIDLDLERGGVQALIERFFATIVATRPPASGGN